MNKTQVVGVAGMGGVASSFLIIYGLLTDPTALVDLYAALQTHQDVHNIVARFAAAFIGLALSGVAALVGAYFQTPPAAK
jgi:hypothetical protein